MLIWDPVNCLRMFSLRYMGTRCQEGLGQLACPAVSPGAMLDLSAALPPFLPLVLKWKITLSWGVGQSNKGTLRLACNVKTVNYSILWPTYISNSRVLISIRLICHNAVCSNPFAIFSEQQKWVRLRGGGIGQGRRGGRKAGRKEGGDSFWMLIFFNS